MRDNANGKSLIYSLNLQKIANCQQTFEYQTNNPPIIKTPTPIKVIVMTTRSFSWGRLWAIVAPIITPTNERSPR